MYQPVVLYVGLRYMHGRSSDRFGYFVSWLSTLGITLGVMSLVTVLSVMNGFERELEGNILRLMPQVLLTTPEGRLDPKHIPVSLLDNLVGITSAALLTTSDVVLQSARSVAVGVMLGINPEDPEPLWEYLLDAKKEEMVAGQYRVILGDELASTLGVQPGDAVRLMVPGVSQFTPIGRIPLQRIFTVAGTFSANSEVDGYQLLVNLQDASRIMRYPAGYATGWRLWLQQPLAVARLSAQSLPAGLVWHDWRESKGALFQAVHMEKNMIGLLLSLIIAVAAFNIMTSLGMLVMEKEAEVAILQTQGLTRREIMLVFIIQGASTGMCGALLGSAFGAFLASQLCRLMPVLSSLLEVGVSLPVVIKPAQIAVIALSTIAMVLLSTIYPSWRAAVSHPAEALRYD
ncbi:lipoprotein-releasing ABC transporter permease subunit LolC [secondary endosymbiont of Ctenarytaina eucalypti]|uniref:Lipoprotein releasing system, transmembrane protein, LolC/E family n=1 Tax=secondary endosymbiont of Ctenarytaina eucalypti TaxID=1199245 RepID=J3YSA7_9ENTR|nr:lipoprotein-releasing ABC transporter permease subunit LolC [secondary endosymbiont of Ctenarytaina eucalypti]AFP85098.1 lipoprotein releasing system, transmembrane protein, LolC/E family [secondary endosymbiont of Ctenarytaina eucalypti]